MAQNKKRKHGKVEAKKIKPVIRFKLGVLLLLIILAFGGCFALYMMEALSQEDYWEKEIVGSTENVQETGSSEVPTATESVPSAAVNPVPESPAAEESRLAACAFLGEVAEFTTYYETASGMVFTDAVSDLTESGMQAAAKQLADQSPLAVYLWYQCPEDAEQGGDSVQQLIEILQGKLADTPIYLLTALPTAGGSEENQRIDSWNSSLFSVAEAMDVHYVDVSTKLKANDGTLAPAYTEAEARYRMAGELILTHVAD